MKKVFALCISILPVAVAIGCSSAPSENNEPPETIPTFAQLDTATLHRFTHLKIEWIGSWTMVDNTTGALSVDSNARIYPSEFQLVWDYTSFTLAGKDSYSHQPSQPGSHEDSYYGSTDCAISATVAATNKISGSVNYLDNYSVANHWGSVYYDLSRQWIFTFKDIALQEVYPDSIVFYSTGLPLKNHIAIQHWTFVKPHFSESTSFKEFQWNRRISPTLKFTFIR